MSNGLSQAMVYGGRRTGGWAGNNPVEIVAGLWRRRHLLWQFTVREVQGRYRGSYLGIIWALLNPLVMMLVYTFFLHTVFGAKWDPSGEPESFIDYAMHMFGGLVAFNVFSETANRSPLLVVQNANLVKKVVFPLEILSASVVGAALFQSVLAMGVLLVAAACDGQAHWAWLFLPILYLPLAGVSLGVSWLISSLGVFLRDLSSMMQVMVQVLLFLTPVMYSGDRFAKVPWRVARIMLSLNPLAPIVTNFRRAVIDGLAPAWGGYAWSLVAAAVLAMLGHACFMRIRGAFADGI